VVLIGNPNAGKTSLFNCLTGLHAKTANFPGTTIERRIGRAKIGGHAVEIVDLPGLYSLSAATNEERVARDALVGGVAGELKPSAAIIIVDATNLDRNLFLASQVIELGVPCLLALNMMDVALRAGIRIDQDALSKELGVPVVGIAARNGWGVRRLTEMLQRLLDDPTAPRLTEAMAACSCCTGCPHQSRYHWAEGVSQRCATAAATPPSPWTQKIDATLTRPVIGAAAFFAVMTVVFLLIFWIASYPMGWIDGFLSHTQGLLGRVLPAGDARDLLTHGVIGGVGGMLVFLPQIAILFFFLALLEDTGYLARAVFVMDRLMRRVGLSGKAFVPMLSGHACAVPAIMSARVIDDWRDRLVTILVLPLMSCSARIPVYAMITALLFPNQPLKSALLFTAAYGLGTTMAVVMAFLFKRTILPGESKALVLELPPYRLPSLRNAALATLDRVVVFLKKAGSIILLISVVLWALSTYPRSAPPSQAVALAQQAELLEQQGQTANAQALRRKADQLTDQHALANSAAGRLGHLLEPVIRPLGFDWQIGVGIVSSFAAREVIVSTLAIIYGVGDDATGGGSLYDTLRAATRSDGTPIFTTATCLSLLVFYVLAMQCLPTQVITRRETGSWRWPLFQLVYMSVLAYAGALLTYQIALRWAPAWV